jgi:hypothetical protein
VRKGENSFKKPREDGTVKALLKNTFIQRARERKMEYKEKTSSFQEGYSTNDELIRISNSFWDENIYREEKTASAECAFLLSHHYFLRGENVRACNFSDFFVIQLANEGYFYNKGVKGLVLKVEKGIIILLNM